MSRPHKVAATVVLATVLLGSIAADAAAQEVPIFASGANVVQVGGAIHSLESDLLLQEIPGMPVLTEAEYVSLATSRRFIGPGAPYQDVQEWWQEHFGFQPGSSVGNPNLTSIGFQIVDLGNTLYFLNPDYGFAMRSTDIIGFMANKASMRGTTESAAEMARNQYNLLFSQGVTDHGASSNEQYINVDTAIADARGVIDYYRGEPGQEEFIRRGDELLALLEQVRQDAIDGYLITVNRERANSVDEALQLAYQQFPASISIAGVPTESVPLTPAPGGLQRGG